MLTTSRRVAVVGHGGIVDLEDTQVPRDHHRMGVGGKKQTIVLSGTPYSQELILHIVECVESNKILGHIPQLGGNLPARTR